MSNWQTWAKVYQNPCTLCAGDCLGHFVDGRHKVPEGVGQEKGLDRRP